MKLITIETHGSEYYEYKNVTTVRDDGVFTTIQADQSDGRKDTHKFATGAIKRLSCYDKTDVVVIAEPAAE